MTAKAKAKATMPVSAGVLALRSELKTGMRTIGSFDMGERHVEVCAGADAIWAIVRRDGKGGIALRLAHCPGGPKNARKGRRSGDERMRVLVDGPIGRYVIALRASIVDLGTLRATVELTPSADLLIPFHPRDLYPLDNSDDPVGAHGKVEAAQRGLNSGLCYLHVDKPAFGSVLYFQNLTALNSYFRASKTKPDAAVGGEWPELGYLPPTPPQSGTPPTDALPAGVAVIMSDAILVFHDDPISDEQQSAHRFLQLLGVAYRQIDLPPTEYRDWIGRAERTLHDLETAPEATLRHYGRTYVHPYTDAEYPDVMVQTSIVASLRDYAAWRRKPIPFEQELSRGVGSFHDSKLHTMRRYLPNVGKDKDKFAVDSWYLYHPLLNLGRMALDGDAEFRKLFEASIDYAVKVAHHFKYAWPIQFKVDSFDVIVKARNDDGLGQTDVGGIYAYVMLQAHELTGKARFLREARNAIDAARDMRFELNYQANLTAWGAAACLRLWRMTNEDFYLRQSYVYLASFFHNCQIWASEIENARHYRNFMAVTCLHDAPYMAMYECFDSFAAFECYMKDSGPDLDPEVRMLISEYCRYALDRSWYYFPDTLPPNILATDVRNGHIDRNLSFPLEDLYPDGQPAGQVGQEVYGAGAVFVYASRSFHTVEGAPFRLFCDHLPSTTERTSERSLSFGISGGDFSKALFSVVRLPGRSLPKAKLLTAEGTELSPHATCVDRIDWKVHANGVLRLGW